MNFFQVTSYIKHYLSANTKGHGVHSPFIYQLCEQVFYNKNSFYPFEKIEQIRTKLQNNNKSITIKDFGAGSKKFKGNTRKISDIAYHGISGSKQCELLFKLIHFLNCETIVELGTSLGINTMYLASVNSKNRIYTIEADNNLCELAKKNFDMLDLKNIDLINDVFDHALPLLLEKLPEIDFAYIDGNHTYQSTLNYFEWLASKSNSKTIIVLDDIYWSKEMFGAWKKIQQHPKVKCTIDTFNIGLVFFNPSFIEPVHLKIRL
jgi:predicted O-methyltransferase YrrM